MRVPILVAILVIILMAMVSGATAQDADQPNACHDGHPQNKIFTPTVGDICDTPAEWRAGWFFAEFYNGNGVVLLVESAVGSGSYIYIWRPGVALSAHPTTVDESYRAITS